MKIFLFDQLVQLQAFNTRLTDWTQFPTASINIEENYPAPDGTNNAVRLLTSSEYSGTYDWAQLYYDNGVNDIGSDQTQDEFFASLFIKNETALFSQLFIHGYTSGDLYSFNNQCVIHWPTRELEFATTNTSYDDGIYGSLEYIGHGWNKLTFSHKLVNENYHNLESRLSLRIGPTRGKQGAASSATYGAIQICYPSISKIPITAENISSYGIGEYAETVSAIELDPGRGKFNEDKTLGNITHSINGTVYAYGNKKSAIRRKYRINSITNSEAARVNSWWAGNQSLFLQHECDGEVTSCQIVNKTLPFGEYEESDNSILRGSIELEVY